ncbi:MAG: hypothetical protein ABEK17_01565 [Candidatus Aenigmatarchaeota archaeon]
MLLILKNLASCDQCGSNNTEAEMLVPSKNPENLRGRKEDSQRVEIFCKDCGNISRREIELRIE